MDPLNPTPVLETAATYTIATGSNRLEHIGGAEVIDFGYDLNGNITGENTRTLIYDLSNQLVRVLDGGTPIAQYTYNGAGQRIKKVTSETRIFHYDIHGQLIAETNATGQTLVEYVYLNGELLAMIKPGSTVYYYHCDHLGTPRILTNESGTVAWKATYSPFGQTQILIQTVENPFRFKGHYYDSETGYHYNWHRYYDPDTGRYTSSDPIGLDGGINPYLYVHNDPVNLLDPYGLSSIGAIKKALKKVYEEIGGRLPKCKPGKFGSPQRGTPGKGYRLDPPHPNALPGSPESGPHINWWDYTQGKKGRGGRSGAVPISGIIGSLVDPFEEIKGEIAEDPENEDANGNGIIDWQEQNPWQQDGPCSECEGS